MSTISFKKVKARKDHKCDWCEAKILKGNVYTKYFNVYEGEPFTWKNHIHCEEIASKLKMFDECADYGLDTDSFMEFIKEEYIRLMNLYHSEIFEYEFFEYPNFEERLKFVCEFHKVEFINKNYSENP